MHLHRSQYALPALLFCLSLVFAMIAFNGCGGGSAPAPTLNSLHISSPKSSVDLGLSVQLIVTGSYSNGSTQDLTGVASWSSSASGVASVSAAGLVNSLSQGTTIISASYSGVTTSFTITVGPAVLQSIDVTPGNGSVPLGRTQQFTATGKYTDRTSQPLGGVIWSSSATTVATISATGLLTSKSVGNTTVTATSGGVSGSTTFAVGPAALVSIAIGPADASVAAGLTLQLIATGTYSDSSLATLTGLNWSSSDETLATVASDGKLTSHHQGSVTITASSGQIAGNELVVITAPLLTGISLSKTNASVYLGSSTPTSILVNGNYTDGSTSDVSQSVSWSYSIPFIASVDSAGVIQPNRVGYTEAWATLGAFNTGRAGVTVLSHPRYAFVPSGYNQAIDRATLSESTARLRWVGSTRTNLGNSMFECATTDPDSSYMYVAHGVPGTPNTGQVEIYKIDADLGTANPIPSGTPVSVTVPVSCIAFEPTGHFGYSAVRVHGENYQLITFQRSTTSGAIAQVSSTSLPADPSDSAIDPTGRFLYLTVTTDDVPSKAFAYGYSIDAATGALTPIDGTPFAVSRYAGSFSFHPNGRFAYLADSQGAAIDTYSVDASTGKLALLNTLATCVGPSALQFSLAEGNPAGPFAYSSCSGDGNNGLNSGLVQAYSVLANGSLLPINSAPGEVFARSLRINTSGNALYELGLNDVRTYSLNSATGEVTSVDTVGAHVVPASIILVGGDTPITQSPSLAVVSSTGDNKITSYRVAGDGSFSNPQSVAVQTGPFSMSALPWGKQVLVASAVPKPALSAYLFTANGGLQFVRNFGESQTSAGVAIDPSGIWAIDADSTNNGLHIYGDAGQYGFWGTWTQNFFATELNPGPIVIDSVGRYIFVGNRGSNSITVYQRDTGWINLTEMTSTYTGAADGSPYNLPASPVQLAVDQNGNFLYVLCSDNTVRVFSIDYYGGHLTAFASTTLPAVGAGVAVIPNADAFVAADTNGLHAFSVNRTTGGISAGDTVSLVDVNGVYADPAGGLVYATTSVSGGGAVYGYVVDASGHLSAVASNPVATSNQPSAMTFKSRIE